MEVDFVSIAYSAEVVNSTLGFLKLEMFSNYLWHSASEHSYNACLGKYKLFNFSFL